MPNAMRRDTCTRTHLARIPGGGIVLLFCLVLLVPATVSEAATPLSDLVAKGKYVFGAAGGCGCHTEPKGPVNAGGRRFDGPFGTVYSSNITSDRQTGM